ncbi:hypothetical protein K439DRAFT_1631566 [Ramaria rubella]|nr:hypothetical protein K439DRAFT_1631566 [Ramaria rubella]
MPPPVPIVRPSTKPAFEIYRDPPSPPRARVEKILDPQSRERKGVARGLQANQFLKENQLSHRAFGMDVMCKEGVKGKGRNEDREI